MARQRKSLQQQYYPYLRKLFIWLDGTEYAKTHVFMGEDLARINPENLVRYMKLLAYGTETPGPDDHPTARRSSGLAFLKKAISYFMPDNTTAWNTAAGTGNPTMSKSVNKLIKDIKKSEVRKQGKESQAKRDMTRPEFKKTLELLVEAGGFAYQFRSTAMLKLQFHLIARTDDISNLESSDLREHEQFGGFALQTQVAWSKNVQEERDCPPQIILGANDADFCCLIGLAGYLESRFESSWGNARYLFGETNSDDEPFRTNSNYRNALRSMWMKHEFKILLAQVRGGIGTHSIRKFASTWSSEHGCSHTEVETRGRWKGGKSGRVVNLYINVKQLPTDGKVAGVLCVGQPVKYKLKENSGVTREWLLTNVVPGIRDHYDTDPNNRIADVLALPLLYACLEPGLEHLMEPAVRQRVMSAWEQMREEEDHELEWNPVQKVVLQVHRYENTLVIDELLTMGNNGGGPAGGDLAVAHQAAGNAQALGIMVNQIHQVRQEAAETKQAMESQVSELRSFCQHQFTTVHRTLGKMIHQAPVRRVVGDRPAAPAVAAATGARTRPVLQDDLAKCTSVRTLHLLWKEWTDGLDGNMPASQLARSQRGGKKRYLWYKRKHVWDAIKRMTDKGIHHTVAIDAIEQAYGRGKTISHYIDCLKRDKKTGGHPNLVDV